LAEGAVLTRYWITFEYPPADPHSTGPSWQQIGFGVTAEDLPAAMEILRTEWFDPWGVEIPPIREATENVDVSTLQERLAQLIDPLPFMNPPDRHGMWFPTTKPIR
jgi:hypothetical protein